jgi:hypothetical protein
MANGMEKLNNNVDCNSQQENEQCSQIESLYEEKKQDSIDKQPQGKSEQDSAERRAGQDRRRFAYRMGIQDRRSGRDRRRKKSK